MAVLITDLNNINLDNNFDEGDPETIWLGILNFKNTKHLKKVRKDLMLIVLHPKTW